MKADIHRPEARAELAEIARSLRELIQGRLSEVRSKGGAPVSESASVGSSGARRAASQALAAAHLAAGPTKPASQAGARPATEALSQLQEEVSGCEMCALHETRSNVVFGSGTGSTAILFIGEAPGRDEDLQGLPFVGRAGQLLTKIIEAIEFKREDCYIANVLKCRPPGNRNPLPEEVARCRPHLMKQIEFLRPKVICTLGVFATQALLDTKSPLTVLRGRVHNVNGLSVVPTYHPAACLRYPRLKAAVWEDVKLLRQEYLS